MKPISYIPLGITALLVLAGTASAQIPSIISYQGRVQVNGTYFSGAGQFKFALVSPGMNIIRRATAVAGVTGGFITSISVTDGGAGYTTAPAVTITDATGSGASATANVSSGMVTSITVNNAGSGYSSSPTVSIARPPPSVANDTLWTNDGTTGTGNEPASAVTVAVQQGLFTVFLGDTTLPNMEPVPLNVFAQEDVRLRIWFNDGVQGFTRLVPDQNLGSVGYAMTAGQLASTTEGQPLVIKISSLEAMRIDPAGNVGIGTATPQQLLHLNVTPGHGEGMEIDSSIAGHSPAIYLNHTGSGGHNFRVASFGDNSNPGSFRIRDDTAGADRFVMDAGGGVRFDFESGKKFSLGGNGTFEIDAPGIVGGRFFISDTGNVGIGTNAPTERLHVIGNILATGTITPNSDRNAKTGIAPVDSDAILERVARLPIHQWRFKTEPEEVKHVGPMAQDFRAAFGLGAHETAIATVDADGVALAAIQGLNQKVEQQRAELNQKETEITELKQRLEKMEQLLNSKLGGGAK